MFDDRKQALIRALIYPIQFDEKPAESVERMVQLLGSEQLMEASWNEYLEAIDSALESRVQLSELIPQDHSEEVIRGYLAQLQHAFKNAAVRA